MLLPFLGPHDDDGDASAKLSLLAVHLEGVVVVQDNPWPLAGVGRNQAVVVVASRHSRLAVLGKGYTYLVAINPSVIEGLLKQQQVAIEEVADSYM